MHKLKDIDLDEDKLNSINKFNYWLKDRVVPLPRKIIEELNEYIKMYKPVKWLFEGHNKHEKYSETSIQEVFKNCLEKSPILIKGLHCIVYDTVMLLICLKMGQI